MSEDQMIIMEPQETWIPTLNLRWKRVANLWHADYPQAEPIHCLQQLWTSNFGKQEWRDIPVEE